MSTTNKNEEVPTLLVKDSQGSDLLCFLEQVVPLEGNEYALLTPVDTPVSLFQLIDDQDPKLIETIEKNEPILEVADVVLQEHDLRLVRSAITLTVSGELDEPEPEEIEEEDIDEESETYELLVNFRVDSNEYGLYIPLDPFFIVGKLEDGEVKLVEGEQLDRIQSGIEAELEERGLSE
ncbi:DUF3727 domain-containing protein [Prochlorococcus sp. MIT 1011]|jgi:hypothetical protein|uniref:DUF3727 domain-containing protein n=1 Tax=Prochlorococcus sp. MIT 1011 TaxID=3082520 RepID=UPI0039B65467|tara:strand:- start:104 stop:640 length:537 start_codon:yes stop_codon:yes gene_type:complete